LLTIRGLRALEAAEVVVYDDLVNNDLLDICPSTAKRIYVGKRAGVHYVPQEKISREVTIPEVITIQELANRMAERAVDVIKLLMKQGQMHLNQIQMHLNWVQTIWAGQSIL